MNKSELSNKNTYRPDIDGLRAIAVLLVIGFHLSPNWIKSGFIGVDIFFVISGYLITKNIVEDLYKNKFEFIDFYSRRVRRIFPALIVVLFFSAMLGWYYLLSPEYKQLGKHIAGGAIFVENLLYFSEVGYFDTNAYSKPLLNLWSLGIEEQFYVVWPLFIWICWRKKTDLIFCILALTLISFSINIYEVTNQNEGLYYLPQTRFWELGAGAMLACLHNKELLNNKIIVGNIFNKFRISKRNNINNITSSVGVVLLIIGLLKINNKMIFPGWWALAPVLGTFLIIHSGKDALINKNILSAKLLVWIGLISFPLYLWHWILLSFTKIIYLEGFNRTTRLLVLAISFLLAWLTYLFIEKPVRNSKNFHIKTSFICSLMVFIFVIGVLIYLNNGFPNRQFSKNFSVITSAFNDWNWQEGMIDKTLSNGKKYSATKNEEIKIAFIGDSHVEQFGPRLQRLAQEGKISNSAFYTSSGCPPIPNVYDDKHPHCRNFISEIDVFLKDNPTIKTIIIGACWNCYFETESSEITNFNNFNYYYEENNKKYFYRDRSQEGVRLSKVALQKYISELSEKYKVYLLLDNPMSEMFDPRNMISNRFLLRDISSIDTHIPLSTIQFNLNEELKKIAEKSNINFIDQIEFLCPNHLCARLYDDGMPIYNDDSHLRPGYVKEKLKIFDNLEKNP